MGKQTLVLTKLGTFKNIWNSKIKTELIIIWCMTCYDYDDLTTVDDEYRKLYFCWIIISFSCMKTNNQQQNMFITYQHLKKQSE